MLPNSTNPAAASLIPAAHIPQAMAAAAQNKNPGVMEQLKAMQAQLNALLGSVNTENMPDVVLVNSSGRIVEVDGKMAMELLSKPGFRKATPDEEERYRKAILLQTPQYLRRMEAKRLSEEKKLLDEIESLESENPSSVEDLLHAPVTDAQTSGTPAPTAMTPPDSTPPATANASRSTNDTQRTQAAANTETSKGTDDSTTTPPPRRGRGRPSRSTNDTQTNTPVTSA